MTNCLGSYESLFRHVTKAVWKSAEYLYLPLSLIGFVGDQFFQIPHHFYLGA